MLPIQSKSYHKRLIAIFLPFSFHPIFWFETENLIKGERAGDEDKTKKRRAFGQRGELSKKYIESSHKQSTNNHFYIEHLPKGHLSAFISPLAFYPAFHTGLFKLNHYRGFLNVPVCAVYPVKSTKYFTAGCYFPLSFFVTTWRKITRGSAVH